MKAQLSLVAAAAIFLHASWISPKPSADNSAVIKKQTVTSPEFSFFRSHRQGAGVTTTWGLSSNNGVSGFLVQRTYEDPTDPYAYWENICSMPCGNGRSFKHTDATVSPGFISYRVVAYLQPSGELVSSILTEHVVSH